MLALGSDLRLLTCFIFLDLDFGPCERFQILRRSAGPVRIAYYDQE
jgi:hypothetical protein